MATKKAVTKKTKDRWCYMLDDDEAFGSYPSYETAYKDAVANLKENAYYGDPRKIKVQFFQLAKESFFEFEVKETQVTKQTVVFKGEAK